MGRVILRPTRAEDFAQITGDALPFRVWAITGEIGNRVIGIGGLGYIPGGPVAMFAALRPEARRYKIALHKAGLRVLAMARQAGIRRAVAMADCDIEAASRWLLRLGFKPIKTEGEVVYIWQH